jgi:hypothetical protein
MATKTLGLGGDYSTFAAAVAGIATWDVLKVITAGTYTEAAALAFSKSVGIVNLSGGQVKIQTPLGSHVGQISGGVTVEWDGDFVHEIRKPGSGGTEYIWLINGSGSRLILNGVELKSDYTTGKTQAIYQQAGNSHELHDCTLSGTYEALVTLADNCVESVIDGLTINGSTGYIVRGRTASAMFDVWDWRNLSGEVTRCPACNGASGNRIDVTTSGLLTTSRLWGMTATGNMVLSSGSIMIEKSVFHGTKAYAIGAVAGVSTGMTFRDVAFCGFSSYGVRVFLDALPGLIDYCGVWDCPALSNSAGSEGIHNVTADPLFADYAGHDYRLTAGSPYLDAGTTCVATIDPDGVVIPQGDAPDIGAFEVFVPIVAKLIDATATDLDEVTITADKDLTDAIAIIGDWAVTADNIGTVNPSIDSITIGSPNTTAVIKFTTNLTPREDYTITATSIYIEPGFNVLNFSALPDGARLVSANINAIPNTIVVVSDMLITTASNGASKWSVSVVGGFGDTLTVVDAKIQSPISSYICGLTYTGTPTPGAKYLITTTSTEFETGYNTVNAVVSIAEQDITPEPFLPSLLSAIGKQIAVDTGFPQTVLTSLLTPGDTHAHVESTLNFPDANGILYINGVRLEYESKTANSFVGLTWATTNDGTNDYYLDTEVILDGAPVMDYSQTYSLQDKATNENIINRSFGKQLKRLAKSLGFPVPLPTMTDTDIQEYLNERMYQPTGIPSAIFRTLRPVLRALELAGTATVSGAATITGVIIDDPLQVTQMLGRWVEINGRIAKIFKATLTAPDTYTWEFVAYDGYCWQHPTLTEVGVGNPVAWRLIPFLFNSVVTETFTNLGPYVGNVYFDRAAQFNVHLFIGNQIPDDYPVGYWLEDHTVDMPGGGLAPSDGRSIHNYLAEDHLTEATADDRFLYLLDDYDFEITEILSDLLPAGVIANVIIY